MDHQVNDWQWKAKFSTPDLTQTALQIEPRSL